MDYITELENAKQIVREVLEKCECESIFPQIIISFNSRFTRRMGYYKGTDRKKYIFLSAKLWPYASEEQRKQTIVHETIHAVTHHKYGVCNHSGLWVRLMELCGVNPHVYHDVDVSAFKRKSSKKTVFECNCSSGIIMGPTRTKRIKQGYTYVCTRCNSKIDYTNKILKEYDST